MAVEQTSKADGQDTVYFQTHRLNKNPAKSRFMLIAKKKRHT